MSEPINPPQTIPSYHLSRLAREARAVLMAHYLLRAAIYVATLIEDCTRYFGKLVRRVAHELYLRSAARTLQQFDERTLADAVCVRPRSNMRCVMAGWQRGR
jgi:hypothetical protein